MRNRTLLSVCLLLPFVLLVSGFRYGTCDQLDRKQLREMLVQMGYTVNDLEKAPGKEKYSVTVTRGGLNVPVALEISANNNFVWLTVYIGAPKPDNAAFNYGLLKKNADIQPAQFYITKSDKLMLAFPIANQGITNASLKDRLEGIIDTVVATKDVWGGPAS